MVIFNPRAPGPSQPSRKPHSYELGCFHPTYGLKVILCWENGWPSLRLCAYIWTSHLNKHVSDRKLMLGHTPLQELYSGKINLCSSTPFPSAVMDTNKLRAYHCDTCIGSKMEALLPNKRLPYISKYDFLKRRWFIYNFFLRISDLLVYISTGS